MENAHDDFSTNQHEMQASFRIDSEFANKIPPIGDDEFKQLRENILTAGEVYEPLVVWNGILVDGHNRWKVIKENPNLIWRTRVMDFSDKWAAFEWMYKNQLGRRNLTDEQRTYTIGKMYEARKQSQGGDHGNQYTKEANGQNVHLPTPREIKDGTAGEIGKEVGMDGRSVRRSEKFAQGIDILREASPEAADKVLSGKAGTTKTEIADLVKQEPDIIEAFAQAINEGKKPKRKPQTEEEKRNLAEIEAIAADMRDSTSTSVFTIDYLIEDIKLNGHVYVELLANTIRDRQALITNENRSRIVAAINSVVDGILKVRGSI